ncbi:hypothetical protein MAPG_01409 [Magnaporthiopsis poae ATCC 64411]|uniref:Zn(2)-C6 fungal-type domain-containing protein n=1 Tax=Magnaporthiopsis poae (strain ATCC 64411 / 73-15) TaxID=644358 RepID=A0A0C4DNL7_MAGP6|nr:hypothetical protein MAPG_01409 [Magnaporthiopsis poae ATCC 64411]
MEADVSVETTPPSGEASKDSYSGNEDRSIYRARACLRCSRSKLRCMRTADPSVKPCVRCARLGAECTIPEAKPRGPRRGQGRRVGQLEQKLDGIMSLLTASKHLNEQRPNKSSVISSALTSSALEPFGRVFPPGPGLLTSAPSYPPTVQECVPVSTPESLSHRTDSSSKATPPDRTAASVAESSAALDEDMRQERYEIFPGLELNGQEARAALDTYRNIYQPDFPFVPISKKTSPAALFAKSPLIFRAIAICCVHQAPSLQREGDRWFRSHIAQRVVVNGEKNLELLQSIIIFFAWCDYRYFIHPKGTALLHLAMGLVMELGLNKPPVASHTQKHHAMVDEAFQKFPTSRMRASYSREDMRSLLGAFYCSTLCATLFRREHYLPYTDFVDQCCTELLENEEHPTDRALVTIVRMLCLVRRAHALLPGAHPFPEMPLVLTPSVAIGLAALRRELDELATSFPAHDIATSHFLRLHYHASIVAMHEPAIYARSLPAATAPLGPNNLPGLKRGDALWHCLRAANDYVEAYLEIPAELVGLQPLPHTALMNLCIMAATRLLFLQDGDWDAIAARRIFDFPAVISRVTDWFAAGEAFEASRGNGPTGTYRRRFQDDDCTSFMSSYVAKLLWLRQWYMARTAPPGHNVALPGEDPIPDDTAPRYTGTEQTELQPQQWQKEAGAPLPPQPDLPKSVPYLCDPASAAALETPNPAPVGFDMSYFDTFDESFWHAFMMDPQMAVPPLHLQIDPPV